jgi:hypothetical protein
MIESDFDARIVCECRGIILDENNNWGVVAFPFTKFFNYGEGRAANIDWSSCKVQEKVDGSLITLFYYNNKWRVSTSGGPDAGGDCNDFGFTFAELFWKTFDQYDVVLPTDKEYCFFFELTSPYNKIVVHHNKAGLTMLGGRNIISHQEISAADAAKHFTPWRKERRSGIRAAFDQLPVVKEFPLTSFTEIYNSFPSISPTAQEGYVVVDSNFNRVKCKSPAYVALHHLRDGLSSQRALVSVVLNGEIDEVVVSFPEYKEQLVSIKSKIDAITTEMNVLYSETKDIVVQKECANAIITSKCPGALFAIRAKKHSSVMEYLRSINIDNVCRLIGVKIVQPKVVINE